MEIVNLTPHAVRVTVGTGSWEEYLPSGQVARVEMTRVPAGTLENGVPMWMSEAGDVTGLPPEAENSGEGDSVAYIVSRVVLDACAARGGRWDLLVPDDLVRDAAGRVTGCRGFLRSVGEVA